MKMICGHHFKSLCDASINKYGVTQNLTQNRFFSEPLVFIKTDHIPHVINSVLEQPVRIMTHNGDRCIDSRHSDILEHPNLIHWYAQNINIKHVKLSSIPIGIANPQWLHGDQKAIKRTISKNNKKTNLVHAAFALHTNPTERHKCLGWVERNGFELRDKLPFETYLNDLSRSMFAVSPNGNGIDCHRTWESLYLKTTPIVTRSVNTEQYSHLPMIVIDSWDDMGDLQLNKDTYNSIWAEHKSLNLKPEQFIT